jgi:hypothetical protein
MPLFQIKLNFKKFVIGIKSSPEDSDILKMKNLVSLSVRNKKKINKEL